MVARVSCSPVGSPAGHASPGHATLVTTASPESAPTAVAQALRAWRILFTCRPLLGHLQPLVGLAEAARAAGCAVAFATAEPAISSAREAGFIAFDAGEPDTFPSRVAAALPQLPTLVGDAQREFWFATVFADLELGPRARDLEAIMSGWQPDLVVHEVAELAAPLVSTSLGVPYVDVGYGSLIPRRLLEAAGTAARPHWSARGLEPGPVAGLFRYLYVDPCPPALQRGEIGVLPWVQRIRPQAEATAPMRRPDVVTGLPHEATVYLTLGTIWNARTDVFRTVIEALRDDLNVIATVGRDQDPDVLGRQPSSVVIRQFVPQHDVLPWCQAVVCHGGSGTVLGAFTHGLPLLVAPQGADQWSNAQLVAGAGAGRVLLGDEVTVDTVRRDVMALLRTPSFRAAVARSIAGEIAAMPSPAEAFAVVAELA